MVIFNHVTVDIDHSVCENSSAETMAGKRKQMSSLQKQLVISLFEDGENQCRIAVILEESQSGVSNF